MAAAAALRDFVRALCRRERIGAVLLALALQGCASLYFHDAGAPPAEGLRYTLERLPFNEYWSGIVFNGDKIGYSRFNIRETTAGRYEIASEASFVLRFLGIEKKVHLRARDVVGTALELREFDYDYRIDGSVQRITGRRDGETLEVTAVTGGEPLRKVLSVRGPLYPTSAIALYPVVAGLQVDRHYSYRVYDGQLQRLATVEQHVEGYEKSEFFAGNAYKMTTSLHGQRTTTWIDASGRPVFELALRGVMIAALEDEARAKQYVVRAALNQRETLIDFSLIKPDAPVSEPRRVSFMKVALHGLDRMPPSTALQDCRPASYGQECEIRAAAGTPSADTLALAQVERYLQPSATVQSQHPNIRVTAREIAGAEPDPAAKALRILQWMDAHIEKAPLDVFSAVDVLEQKKAECQGHAYLFTAFARALDIPTRLVNGLVYSEALAGFLFHTWVESWLDGGWRPIDPTFGQAHADATHIRLIEGEATSDLLPLLDWVGRLKLRVLALEHAAR